MKGRNFMRTIFCLFILVLLFRGCLRFFRSQEMDAEEAIDLIKTKIQPENEFPQVSKFIYMKNNQITLDGEEFYYISFCENNTSQVSSLKVYFVRKDGKEIYEMNRFGKDKLIWKSEK